MISVAVETQNQLNQIDMDESKVELPSVEMNRKSSYHLRIKLSKAKFNPSGSKEITLCPLYAAYRENIPILAPISIMIIGIPYQLLSV